MYNSQNNHWKWFMTNVVWITVKRIVTSNSGFSELFCHRGLVILIENAVKQGEPIHTHTHTMYFHIIQQGPLEPFISNTVIRQYYIVSCVYTACCSVCLCVYWFSCSVSRRRIERYTNTNPFSSVVECLSGVWDRSSVYACVCACVCACACKIEGRRWRDKEFHLLVTAPQRQNRSCKKTELKIEIEAYAYFFFPPSQLHFLFIELHLTYHQTNLRNCFLKNDTSFRLTRLDQHINWTHFMFYSCPHRWKWRKCRCLYYTFSLDSAS